MKSDVPEQLSDSSKKTFEMTFDRTVAVRTFLENYGLIALPLTAFDLAMTHRSYAFESGVNDDNERLEFLGDALIAAVASEFLYTRDPAASEGLLSKRRGRLVSRTLLGKRAQIMGLGSLLLLGRGERESGGAQRLSTLGSALEALIGVIYFEFNYEALKAFVVEHVLIPISEDPQEILEQIDCKSTLQEWVQKRYQNLPVYLNIGDDGPPHERIFFVQVEVDGQVLAIGKGPRVKLAQNDAAKKALRCLLSKGLWELEDQI